MSGAGPSVDPPENSPTRGLLFFAPVVPSILHRTAVASRCLGLPRKAPLFAREAVRIDPDHRPAADLLEQLAGDPAR